MSKKRKKKLPLRDEFTDALNVEIAERKIIERTQPQDDTLKKDPAVQMSTEKIPAEVSTENISVPEIRTENKPVEKIPAKNISAEKVSDKNISASKNAEKSSIPEIRTENKPVEKIPAKNISAEKVSDKNISASKNAEKNSTPKLRNKNKPVEKVSAPGFHSKQRTNKKSSKEKVTLKKSSAKVEKDAAPQVVEVKTDPKLEERIFKEADNTFFDDKKTSDETPRKSIFHSRAMKRWEDEQFEEKISRPKVEDVPEIEPPRNLSRPEKFGGIISIVMLVYAFVNFDKPLFFVAMALFVNFLRPTIGAMFGKHSAAVQNALHTFSIVVFFGAILFLFTD